MMGSYRTNGAWQDSCYDRSNYTDCLQNILNYVDIETNKREFHKNDLLIWTVGLHYAKGAPVGQGDRKEFLEIIKKMFPGKIIFMNPCNVRVRKTKKESQQRHTYIHA